MLIFLKHLSPYLRALIVCLLPLGLCSCSDSDSDDEPEGDDSPENYSLTVNINGQTYQTGIEIEGAGKAVFSGYVVGDGMVNIVFTAGYWPLGFAGEAERLVSGIIKFKGLNIKKAKKGEKLTPTYALIGYTDEGMDAFYTLPEEEEQVGTIEFISCEKATLGPGPGETMLVLYLQFNNFTVICDHGIMEPISQGYPQELVINGKMPYVPTDEIEEDEGSELGHIFH